MSREKFDEARRLHRAAVEKFKAAHEDATEQLEQADSSAERNLIRAEYLPKEREALDQAHEAIVLQQRAIAESQHAAATGATPSVDHVRAIAARLVDEYRSSPGFDYDRLRELVRDALIGQGSVVDEATIDEAIRAMAG